MAANLAPQLAIAQISTANPNLDGTGTITALMFGDPLYGTLINSITIKATGSVPVGMIRLFTNDGSAPGWKLFREIPIPDVTQTSQYPAYCGVIMFNTLVLSTNSMLGVSTETNDTFIITVSGMRILGYI